MKLDWYARMEPEAAALRERAASLRPGSPTSRSDPTNVADLERAATVSLAVSAKRIADAAERLAFLAEQIDFGALNAVLIQKFRNGG